MLLLKAFNTGLDGLIISGCHPNDCHYTSGNFHAQRRWVVFKETLDIIGFDTRRIFFTWVSAAEGAKWAKVVDDAVKELKKLGPYEEYRKLIKNKIPVMEVQLS